MAGHESPRTTKLYDRTKDEVTLREVGRIRLRPILKLRWPGPLIDNRIRPPEITRRQVPVILQRVLVGKSPLIFPLSGFWLRP